MRVISLGAILVVLVATIGVFTFAKPQYREPGGNGTVLKFDDAKPPVNGWLFADATPGFHLGEHKDRWNISELQPKEIPPDAGIFIADRLATDVRPEVLYWRRGCLVAQLSASRTRLCQPHAAAVFIAQTGEMLPTTTGVTHDMFLIGVVRSDVTRVVVRSPGATQIVMHGSQRKEEPSPPQVLYDEKTPGWWGSWVGTFDTWHVTVEVYGKHGLIATTHVVFDKPGEAVYCASALRGVCGMSAQRRS